MGEETVNRRNIHWFPGHMARTLRRAQAKLPLVDAVVQLLDARIPRASLNEDLQALYGEKPRLYVLNKADLADEGVTSAWLRYFRREESGCVAINSKNRGATAPARQAVEAALADLMERRREKGMQGAKLRLMVTGIPNVGKSTFINSWVGAARAKAADKPGVTRGEQWIAAGRYELLDMPGVLPKKLEDARTAVNLALIGSIPDHLLDTEEIAAGLLAQLAGRYGARLAERFKLREDELAGWQNAGLEDVAIGALAETPGMDTRMEDVPVLDGMFDDTAPLPYGWALLEAVGRRRGMLVSGGEIDTERAAIMVLDEFRAGKLGRISLEDPEEGT